MDDNIGMFMSRLATSENSKYDQPTIEIQIFFVLCAPNTYMRPNDFNAFTYLYRWQCYCYRNC